VPENFSSLLEALDSEGRTLARPAPAAVIETVARGRRRRHRFTAATSVVAVCAVAVGAVLGFGGSQSHPAPITPAPSPPSVSGSVSASAAHGNPVMKNRTGADGLLLASEAPQPALFQWTRDVFVPEKSSAPYTTPLCGLEMSGQPKNSHAQSSLTASYQATNDGSSAEETIYHYSSAAAARQDFDVLKPDSATCPTVRQVAAITDGFAWQDMIQGQSSLHRMVVLSGTDIAYWFYDYAGGTAPYDTSGDQAALQRMADRLDGGTPVPDPVTTAPPGTLPASAWLDVKQIPFATADESQGWVPMGIQQEAASGPAATNLCEAVTDGGDFVGATGATILTRAFHGSPPHTPVYSGSNYLYSSANQNIVSFPNGPAQAQAAFQAAEQVTTQHSCQFKDGSGPTSRIIKVGKQTASAFSIVASDTPGPGYEHLYCVVKGSNVAWMMISFEHGDASTAGDAAVLDAMAQRLP
jgi:hypothetical protein